MMTNSRTPFIAAWVTQPARSECPPSSTTFNPALPAARFRSLPIESRCRPQPRNMAISSNGTEDRAFSDPGPVEPLAERADRARIVAGTEGQAYFASYALLVGLRFADADDDAVG